MSEDADRSIGIKQFYTRVGGKIQVNPHPKQAQVFRSVANIIAVLAGTQSGKTLSGPVWLWKEIQKWDKLVQAGGGAHGAVFWAVSPSYPLMEGKLEPEYVTFFCDYLGIGKHTATKHKIDITLTRDNGDTVNYELILKSADKPDSLASSTVAAMHLDEGGMDSFSRQSWIEAKSRLGTTNGRILITTTLYNHGWLKTQVYDLWKADPIGSGIEVIRFESIDNPLFSRTEWEYAKKTMPPYLFNMRHRGIYDKPGGMVYDCLDEDINYVKPFVLPDGCEKHVGIDPGMVNHSTVWIAELTPSDDVYDMFTRADGINSIYVVYKASLYGSTTTTMTNTEHAKIALADPDYQFVTSWCGGARAEKYFREDYKSVGINVVEPPFTEVEAGISKVYELIKLNRLYFTNDLKEIVSGEFSLQSYSRKMDANGEPTSEIHQKARYHYADAIRYAIAGIGTQSKSSCNIASIQGSALY